MSIPTVPDSFMGVAQSIQELNLLVNPLKGPYFLTTSVLEYTISVYGETQEETLQSVVARVEADIFACAFDPEDVFDAVFYTYNVPIDLEAKSFAFPFLGYYSKTAEECNYEWNYRF